MRLYLSIFQNVLITHFGCSRIDTQTYSSTVHLTTTRRQDFRAFTGLMHFHTQGVFTVLYPYSCWSTPASWSRNRAFCYCPVSTFILVDLVCSSRNRAFFYCPVSTFMLVDPGLLVQEARLLLLSCVHLHTDRPRTLVPRIVPSATVLYPLSCW